jgi:DNA-binding MarR family transcriptional regulator
LELGFGIEIDHLGSSLEAGVFCWSYDDDIILFVYNLVRGRFPMVSRTAAAQAPATPGRADEAVAVLLRENGHLSRQLFRRRMADLGLTAAEARALRYVGAHPGIVQGRLAELLEVQPIALTRVVDRLAADGQVERRLSSTDRRVRLLHLTPKGRALARRLSDFHDSLDRAITERLSARDLAHFAAALSDVNAALRQML